MVDSGGDGTKADEGEQNEAGRPEKQPVQHDGEDGEAEAWQDGTSWRGQPKEGPEDQATELGPELPK